jgi:hypothetical protein
MAVGTIGLQRGLDGFTGQGDGQTHGLRRTLNTVQPTSGANYTTGGSAITAAALGLNSVVAGVANVVTAVAGGPASAAVLVQPDGSVKLKANTGVAEVAANVDLSGASVQIIAWGV